MKQIATDIWKTYDNTHGYVDGKINHINGLDNIGDNAMVMYRMFDWINQSGFLEQASKEVVDYINKNK